MADMETSPITGIVRMRVEARKVKRGVPAGPHVTLKVTATKPNRGGIMAPILLPTRSTEPPPTLEGDQ
jgi:hypothetical protein